jgi:L-aminopeptidase/D-esterase-like protein
MQSRIANGIEIATATVTVIKDVAIRSVTVYGTENGLLDATVMEMPVGGIMKRTSREPRDVMVVDQQMIRVLSPIETGIGGRRMTIQTSGGGTRRYDVIGIAS